MDLIPSSGYEKAIVGIVIWFLLKKSGSTIFWSVFWAAVIILSISYFEG